MMDGRRPSLCSSDRNLERAQAHSTALQPSEHSVEQFCYSTTAVQPAPAPACMVSNRKGLVSYSREQGGNKQRRVAFCCSSTSENLKLSSSAAPPPRTFVVAAPAPTVHFPRSAWGLWPGRWSHHSVLAIPSPWRARPCAGTRSLWTNAACCFCFCTACPGFCRISS
jgi:hypothetical protein